MTIPVIDIFAGPGGLSEGFSSVVKDNTRLFDVRLSIEMDQNAHKTLQLRSFFRKFPIGQAPVEYYDMLMEANPVSREERLIRLYEKYKNEAADAKEEAWCAELGGEHFPPELVDSRIKNALNGVRNWVLIGGPPCQAYSVVGRSRRQWRDELKTEDKRVHLYKEYLRIIAVHHPAVFVMENVKGLLSSKLDGKRMFDLIKSDLQNPSSVFPDTKSPKYKIFSLTTPPQLDTAEYPYYPTDNDYLICSEEYGIPQKRHRVILLGIREDLSITPDTLKKANKPINLSEIIGDLPKIRSAINRSFDFSVTNINGDKERFYTSIKDSEATWVELTNKFKREIISWNGFAKDFSPGAKPVPENGTGSEFVPYNTPSTENPLYKWYHDPQVKGAVNHESRAHLVQDLKRYMFSSMFAKTYQRFPRLAEYEQHSKDLLPDHENARSGKFADRFRVQVPDQPATTVTSHISKDGHYFIHYDPEQCRSLTVREAARIQTFPDNYLFCGSRTAQFHQVGNAVPPFLANQIASVVKDIFIGEYLIRDRELEEHLQL